MKITLRNILTASVATAAIVLASTSAMAAESKINVPFSFTVGNKICPAGQYTVERNVNHNVVTLKSADWSKSFQWTLGPGDSAPTESEVVLKFDESNTTHELRRIQFGSLVTGKIGGGKHSEHRVVSIAQGQ